MGQATICISGQTIDLPLFFPSVSSVKTNLPPVDYVELLAAAAQPTYLLSAYDLANASVSHIKRFEKALHSSRDNGSVVLLDSGNYEAFWKSDTSWASPDFQKVLSSGVYDIGFCFDNQRPASTANEIVEDVAMRVLADQESAGCPILPIIHGSPILLPEVMAALCGQLCPTLVAVPERALGEGIVERIISIRKIRRALNGIGKYFPLHLLGTGNPVSILAYSMAGADSFDGLEWCQTVVNHKTAQLLHFQQWDLIRTQTEWGLNNALPYIQSALMHNLDFYSNFMHKLQAAAAAGACSDMLKSIVPREHSEIILKALSEEG